MTPPEDPQTNRLGLPYGERRRVCTDRRQARGVWNQASDDRRKNNSDRRYAAALNLAMTEADWSEARAARSKARAAVTKAQARLELIRRQQH